MRPGEPCFLPAWYSARALLSPEWAPSILITLLDGPKHYTEILSAVRSSRGGDGWRDGKHELQESILTRTLKRMTADGVLVRVQDRRVFPPSVRYALTAATREMLDAVVPTAEWAERHPEIVTRAQRQRRCGRHDVRLASGLGENAYRLRTRHTTAGAGAA